MCASGRLCLSERSSRGYAFAIDITTVVRGCRRPGCGLALSIGFWGVIGVPGWRWSVRLRGWSVRLLCLTPSATVVRRARVIRITRRGMAVVFVARKVFTYGNGSCRNKGDGQREAWHVDQGKRTLGSGAITKGKGPEWFSYKYGTEFTEPSQAPSSTSEKVKETPIASAGTCPGSGASNTQKVLTRKSEIEGPVQPLSWELWPL